MICPNCKTEISNESKFCPECGLSIGSATKIMEELTYQMLAQIPTDDGKTETAQVPLIPVSEFYCSCGKHYAVCAIDEEQKPTENIPPIQENYIPPIPDPMPEPVYNEQNNYNNYEGNYDYSAEQPQDIGGRMMVHSESFDYNQVDQSTINSIRDNEKMKNVSNKDYYAPPAKRFIASAIDSVLLGVAGYYLYSSLLSAVIAEDLNTALLRGSGYIDIFTKNIDKIGAFAFFWLLVCFIYNVILCFFLRGKTIGKFITKIKIISREDENRPNLWVLIKREIFGKFLSSLPLMLGFLAIIIDKGEHKGWHDKIANTFVINDQ